MREISELKSSPPEGIRIITNEDNLCDVTGIIQGPGTSLTCCFLNPISHVGFDPRTRGHPLCRRLFQSEVPLHGGVSGGASEMSVPFIEKTARVLKQSRTGRMLTKIFHPNVSTAGEICVNTLKKDWQSSYGIAHILVVVKCLLIHPNPESALDEEAGKLLLEDYNRFAEHARMITSVHATPRVCYTDPRCQCISDA